MCGCIFYDLAVYVLEIGVWRRDVLAGNISRLFSCLIERAAREVNESGSVGGPAGRRRKSSGRTTIVGINEGK